MGECSNGREALREIPRLSPDLVFLDIQMPGLDGFETCRRLKSDAATRDVPVGTVRAQLDVRGTLHSPELRGEVAVRNAGFTLAGLEEIYREVFILFHLCDASHPRIARLLGIPEGTSKRRLSVARRRLRTTLEGVAP